MSKDMAPFAPGPEDEGKMVLICVEEQYWLLEGVDHINSMLAGYDTHPKPVICLHFASIFRLQTFLPEGVSVQGLWAIHPGIIDRMRREGDLDERTDPQG